MLDRYGSNSFILFDFSHKVETTTVRNILRNGITINEEEYQFIGCSSNGLKERTCYMFKGSSCDVDQVLEECGSFTSIKSRYKRLKRIGLLFSSGIPTHIEIPDNKVAEEPDIETAEGNFTDGCGAIEETLADQLREFCSKIPNDYRPAVFQIRYQGCKGVVAVHPSLKGVAQLVIRPSMKKFKPGSKPLRELWLCDHSRPYTLGHLNRQFITLLSSLGIQDEVFLRIQNEHFEMLESVLHDSESAFVMFLLNNQPEVASLCMTGVPLSAYRSQLLKLRSKFVTKLEKLQLPVLKSRNVFGVCDPTGVLKYGQCYFRYSERGNSKSLQGRVVVAKNPCYLLGDIRVLTAVHVDGLNHLIDCIVFPTRGKRPHPSEIAGSDLDGDQYFVCWDKDLIVPHIAEPYDYPSVDALETSDKITHETLIDYFASQRNNMGKIDAYYKYWANRKGADCPECQSLGQLFSRSVDATKTGDVVRIPPKLVPPPLFVRNYSTILSQNGVDGSTEEHIHVWEEMEKRAKKKKDSLSQDIVHIQEAGTISEEFLWYLLENKVPNLSEFHLFQLIQAWCAHQSFTEDEPRHKLVEFTKYVNFGEFTVDQQVSAIDAGIPLKTVTNALNKSTLLPQELLQKFLLDDPHRSWRFYFNYTSAEFNWNHLLHGLQHHQESMVIIKLQDNVTFVFHFLSPPQLGETDIDSGSVIAYFSSGHFDLDLQCVLGSKFKLILDEETLHLFRGNKTATFIYLRNEQPRDKQKPDQDILFDRISVDLTSFKRNIIQNGHPKVNKQSFLSIEMFVKSTNFQPAFLDITEADVQDDYPVVEEATGTCDIDDLPTDAKDEERDDDASIEIPDTYTVEAALAVASELAQKGYCHRFQSVLEILLVDSNSDILKLLPALKELLVTMDMKYGHKHLMDKTAKCLQSIITSLYPALTNPKDLLEILTFAGKLGLYSLLEQIIERVLPNLCATQSSEYIDVMSKWKLWYFLPQSIAARLSQHFYTLYTSLCDQILVSHQHSNWSDEIDVSTYSLSGYELGQLASNKCISGSLQQHQVDGYVSHFSHLVLNHLLCEMFASREVGKQACDTSSSLVRMKCYDYKNPHANRLEQDDKGDNKSAAYWTVGFSRTKGISSKKFIIGSYVAISLMKKEGSPQEIVSVPVAIGRIVRGSRNPADIVTEISEPVPLCLKRSAHCQQGHWQILLIGNITSFIRTLKALKSIRDSPSCTALLPLLVNSQCTKEHYTTDTVALSSSDFQTTNNPAETTENFVIQPKNLLNCSQMEAVCASLKQRLTLVHGPPGTGKTHVACEIVQQLLEKGGFKDGPILVVAETNLAVDNLCEKLMTLQVRVVRVGKLEHVSPPVRGISLEGQIEKKRVQEGKDKRRSPFPDEKMIKSILDAAQVVAATCTSAGDSSLKGMKFPFVIIDEATKVTEPTSLIPLVHGCQQLTLIGDPEQLSPTLSLPKKSFDAEIPLHDLTVTLFHRLQRILPSFFLAEQHRMHPELAVFPSRKFYGGKLLTANCRRQQRFPFQEEIPILEQSKPIVFLRVSRNEKHTGTSFCNPAEAKAVVNIIDYLIRHKVSTQQVAVLTPYTGQLKCIQEESQREKIHLNNLYTIDSFQGREADVIVFSTVRCNCRGELGFMNDKYRMNVLLTRAKYGLIGIGCENTLSAGSHLWKEWLESVKVIDDIPRTNSPDKRYGEAQDGDPRRHSSYSNYGVHRLSRAQGGTQRGAQCGRCVTRHAHDHQPHSATQNRQSSHQRSYSASSLPVEVRSSPVSSVGIPSARGREQRGTTDVGHTRHTQTQRSGPSAIGQGRTSSADGDHANTFQTHRGGYETRGQRRGRRGRSRAYCHGGRGGGGGVITMEPAPEHWNTDVVRGQRGNYRARNGRNRGRAYNNYRSRDRGRKVNDNSKS